MWDYQIKRMTDDEKCDLFEANDWDAFIEGNCVSCSLIHPEELSLCGVPAEDREAVRMLRKCSMYEDEWEFSEEYYHRLCAHVWGMGFKGVCERAVWEVIPSVNKSL